MKKFYAVIGNPPYQEDVEGNGRANPIYPDFMDASYSVGEKVELITPARFLFNAGQTPKAWNRKMLTDEHLKVLHYAANGAEVFPNTDIKGGVAVTYRDEKKTSGAIGVFVAFDELHDIITKVVAKDEETVASIITGAVPYRFTDLVRREHPECVNDIGNSFDLRTNVLDSMDRKLFFAEKPMDDGVYVQVFGLHSKRRSYRWIKRDYLEVPDNFEGYKILLPEANGSGALGEVLSTPLIGKPLIGHTQTFISIGNFSTELEAENCLKYVKSKFARTLLGVLKITQHNPIATWKYVPLQDFASTSDIDWSQSVADVDRQLYKKYDLSEDEIAFIESHVKEMK